MKGICGGRFVGCVAVGLGAGEDAKQIGVVARPVLAALPSIDGDVAT